ncbi:MAG: AmmeMemoRadiSam system protein B [Candidatus Methanofastidiosa archaeon]|nr:AmmeMemoRadiSam system protein B [Candidatus Methanofastidiosa archaeon]
MNRRSAAAGTFYPGSDASLAAMVDGLFAEAGYGRPAKPGSGMVCGVCPHAGYPYSGPMAVRFYGELATAMPSRVILLGPNHTGRGRAPLSIMTEGSWHTPLGDVPIDSALATAILGNAETMADDPAAHAMEHSLEVQLPFLQRLGRAFSIVPIALNIQDLDSAIEVSRAIRTSCSDDVAVIASSDLVHFGQRYGYAPVSGTTGEIIEWVERNDRQVLTMIVEKDVDGLYDFIATLNYTMCGYGPCAAVMLLAAHFGLEGTVLGYTNSYQRTGDPDLIVGYGSVLFR